MAFLIMKRGLEFILPTEVDDKKVSVIEVGPFSQQGLASELNLFFGTNIQSLMRTDSYILVHDPTIGEKQTWLTGKPFVDPIIHRATLNTPLSLELGLEFDYVLQSMLNPGTSDAFGNESLKQALLSFGKRPNEGDYGFQSKQYFLRGNLTPQQLEDVSAFLANPNLNQRIINSRAQFEKGVEIRAPIVTLGLEVRVESFNVINMSDEDLLKLNSERKLAGSLEELQQFSAQYNDPAFIAKRREFGLDEKATDVEIETWFGLRSEHCFHKEFNAIITLEDRANDHVFRRAFEKGWLTKNKRGEYVLENGIFKTFIEEPARVIYNRLEKRGKNWILSMFEDNSGVVAYDENFMFNIKFETHNSPTNKEPKEGAKTGLDGVERDNAGTMLGTFGLLAGFFWYATGDHRYRGWLPRGVKHPYELLKRATQGVREAGNETQLPNFGGGLVTDSRFMAKCLLYAGFVGFSPRKSPEGRSYEKKFSKIGDKIFVIGHPVGIDGVHGSTESSLIASANISLGHVQGDNSFCQAKVNEYVLACGRRLLFSNFQDCGAMGFGSAAIEMAQTTGGLEVELDNHPKKYLGIWPFQIVCSETQNRMVGSADAKDTLEIKKAEEFYEVDVTEMGTLTESGYANLKFRGKTVALLDLKRLFNKEPKKQMHATWNGSNEKPNPRLNPMSLEESLCEVMEQPDVASKEWFFRQKDSSVKGGTIRSTLLGIKQEVEADATIQKLIETEGRDYGAIAYALGIAPKVSDIDPYHATQKALIDMAGKIIAIGGRLPNMNVAKWDAWAICGNWCQPNSDSTTTLKKETGEHNLASLLRGAIGTREVEEATNLPVISGKDSMKCSCDYNLNLDEFMKSSDTEFAKKFMQLTDEVREDLDKVKVAMGELYNPQQIDRIILDAIPKDLARHMILSERVVKKKDIQDREYEVRVKAFEMHNPDAYLASCAVKIEDYRKCVDSTLKETGDLIYIIGTTRNELGASAYLQARGYKSQETPYDGGSAPKVNLEEFLKVADGIGSAIDSELVASCSYIHNGGIAAALAKAGIAGEKGVSIKTDAIVTQGKFNNSDEIIYSETPGRFIITIDPKDKEKFEQSLEKVPYALVGEVSEDYSLTTKERIGMSQSVSLDKVKLSYQRTLRFDLDTQKQPTVALAS